MVGAHLARGSTGSCWHAAVIGNAVVGMYLLVPQLGSWYLGLEKRLTSKSLKQRDHRIWMGKTEGETQLRDESGGKNGSLERSRLQLASEGSLTPQLCHKLTQIVGQTFFLERGEEGFSHLYGLYKIRVKTKIHITRETEACQIVETSGLKDSMKHWHLVDKSLNIEINYYIYYYICSGYDMSLKQRINAYMHFFTDEQVPKYL